MNDWIQNPCAQQSFESLHPAFGGFLSSTNQNLYTSSTLSNIPIVWASVSMLIRHSFNHPRRALLPIALDLVSAASLESKVPKPTSKPTRKRKASGKSKSQNKYQKLDKCSKIWKARRCTWKINPPCEKPAQVGIPQSYCRDHTVYLKWYFAISFEGKKVNWPTWFHNCHMIITSHE